MWRTPLIFTNKENVLRVCRPRHLILLLSVTFFRTRFKTSLKNQKGFSIVEALVAMTILMISMLVASRFIVDNRKLSVNANKMVTCENYVASIVEKIKAFDNASVVRTFLPKQERIPSTESRKSTDLFGLSEDPFCKTPGANAVRCDHFNYYACSDGGVCDITDPNMEFVLNGPLYSSQNIRGAATWAMMVHNKLPVPQKTEICSTGVTFTPAPPTGSAVAPLRLEDFYSLLPKPTPSPGQMPAWLKEVNFLY